MKKNRTFFWIAVFFLISTTAAAGTALADDNGPLKKIGRGITNMVEGPLELYTQTVLLPDTGDPGFNLIAGSVKGFGMFLVREAVGIYDIVTFPLPLPLGYKPVIQPATTFTDWSRRKPQPMVNPRPKSLPPD